MAERLYVSPATVKWYTSRSTANWASTNPARSAVKRSRGRGLWDYWKLTGPLPGDRVTVCPCRPRRFIGRTREIDAIAALLANPDVRLVTLLGPGGMGKTRLALEVGWRLVEPEAFGTPSDRAPRWRVFRAAPTRQHAG